MVLLYFQSFGLFGRTVMQFFDVIDSEWDRVGYVLFFGISFLESVPLFFSSLVSGRHCLIHS